MNVRSFLRIKTIIWAAVALLLVGGGIYLFTKPKNNADKIQTDIVRRQDIKQTVLATGQVVSSTDLNLSFKSAGIVGKVLVAEGQSVHQGVLLAALDQKNLLASLTTARGTLAQAEANKQKVLAGASSEDIQVALSAVNAAQTTLENAQKAYDQTKAQQNIAVANAFNVVMNSSLVATPAPDNISTTSPTISGNYVGTESAQYTIALYQLNSGLTYTVYGSESGGGFVKDAVLAPVALGTKGLYIQFPSTSLNANDRWTITIPNTQTSTYTTNKHAYDVAVQAQAQLLSAAQSTIDAAAASLQQSKTALLLKQAHARPADIAAADAQILSAQGQVQAAQAALQDTEIIAPASGVITQVNVKAGEQAGPSQAVMILQDVNSLHVEANVSEANIAIVRPSQPVDLTFDALGPDRHFQATVETVNPASTVVSGVVNYLVKAVLTNPVKDIKPGMTANMTILAAEKHQVLTIPQQAIISQNGNQEVRVIDNSKLKTYHAVSIQTGLQADAGLVEVTGGLNEGQEIVTYISP